MKKFFVWSTRNLRQYASQGTVNLCTGHNHYREWSVLRDYITGCCWSTAAVASSTQHCRSYTGSDTWSSDGRPYFTHPNCPEIFSRTAVPVRPSQRCRRPVTSPIEGPCLEFREHAGVVGKTHRKRFSKTRHCLSQIRRATGSGSRSRVNLFLCEREGGGTAYGSLVPAYAHPLRQFPMLNKAKAQVRSSTPRTN